MKKTIMFALLFALAFTFFSCRESGIESETRGAGTVGESSVPEDFSFALTWNCYGVSSYDSDTGRLVKTTDATHPDDYVTELTLDEKHLEDVYRIISDLGIGDFPDEYNPTGKMSKPPETVILTVRQGAVKKTVACRNVCILSSAEAKDGAGRRFIDSVLALEGIICDTPEWKALPEYEFLCD